MAIATPTRTCLIAQVSCKLNFIVFCATAAAVADDEVKPKNNKAKCKECEGVWETQRVW